MSQGTGKNRDGEGTRRLSKWLRQGWREAYRGKATIVTVVLGALGLLLIFGATSLEHGTIKYEIVRDFGLAALISGTLGGVYEYLLRQDLEESVEERLKDLLDEDTSYRQEGLVKVHHSLNEDLLYEKFAEAKAEKGKGEIRVLVTRTAVDTVVSKYIPEALEAGCKVKVLFLSPESKQVAYRAHHLGRRTEDRLRTQILNELTDLVDMCKDDPDLDLTVKVYDAAPVFHMFDFGRTKLIGPCWRLERSVWGTQFEIQEKTPLAKLVNNHFDDLWDDRRLFNGKHVTEEASKVLDRLAEKDKKPPPEKDKKPPPEKDKKPLRGF